MAVPGRLYRDGNTLKLQNFSGHPRLLIVEQFGFNHYFNNEIFQWINTLAQMGVNGMRVFGFWPFGRGHEEEPYARTGNNYDLTRFNERYFDYLKQWVPYANDKGIFVSSFFSEDEAYFTMHYREGKELVICSEPYPSEDNWQRMTNNSVRVW